MGFPLKKSWHSWTYTSIEGNANQVAGYAVNYDVSSLKGIYTKSIVIYMYIYMYV